MSTLYDKHPYTYSNYKSTSYHEHILQHTHQYITHTTNTEAAPHTLHNTIHCICTMCWCVNLILHLDHESFLCHISADVILIDQSTKYMRCAILLCKWWSRRIVATEWYLKHAQISYTSKFSLALRNILACLCSRRPPAPGGCTYTSMHAMQALSYMYGD